VAGAAPLKFVEKLRYIHRNPVKRGLVERGLEVEQFFVITQPVKPAHWKLNRSGLPIVEVEEQRCC
jgi:hypothetical protein